jgi:hypothetical protein
VILEQDEQAIKGIDAYSKGETMTLPHDHGDYTWAVQKELHM